MKHNKESELKGSLEERKKRVRRMREKMKTPPTPREILELKREAERTEASYRERRRDRADREIEETNAKVQPYLGTNTSFPTIAFETGLSLSAVKYTWKRLHGGKRPRGRPRGS